MNNKSKYPSSLLGIKWRFLKSSTSTSTQSNTIDKGYGNTMSYIDNDCIEHENQPYTIENKKIDKEEIINSTNLIDNIKLSIDKKLPLSPTSNNKSPNLNRVTSMKLPTIKSPTNQTNNSNSNSNNKNNNITSTTTASSNEEVIPERPHTPVIIWRTSAKVKLATDIPIELMSTLLNDNDDNKESSLNINNNDKLSNQPLVVKNILKSVPPTLHPNFNIKHVDEEKRKKKMIESKPKIKYGAWYLKPSEWKKEKVSSNNDDDHNILLAKVDGADDTSDLRHIEDLEIAKAYKIYIMDQQQKTNDSSSMPHYLKKVPIDYSKRLVEASVAQSHLHSDANEKDAPPMSYSTAINTKSSSAVNSPMFSNQRNFFGKE